MQAESDRLTEQTALLRTQLAQFTRSSAATAAVINAIHVSKTPCVPAPVRNAAPTAMKSAAQFRNEAEAQRGRRDAVNSAFLRASHWTHIPPKIDDTRKMLEDGSTSLIAISEHVLRCEQDLALANLHFNVAQNVWEDNYRSILDNAAAFEVTEPAGCSQVPEMVSKRHHSGSEPPTPKRTRTNRTRSSDQEVDIDLEIGRDAKPSPFKESFDIDHDDQSLHAGAVDDELPRPLDNALTTPTSCRIDPTTDSAQDFGDMDLNDYGSDLGLAVDTYHQPALVDTDDSPDAGTQHFNSDNDDVRSTLPSESDSESEYNPVNAGDIKSGFGFRRRRKLKYNVPDRTEVAMRGKERCIRCAETDSAICVQYPQSRRLRRCKACADDKVHCSLLWPALQRYDFDEALAAEKHLYVAERLRILLTKANIPDALGSTVDSVLAKPSSYHDWASWTRVNLGPVVPKDHSPASF